jgi:hypothetical protein
MTSVYPYTWREPADCFPPRDVLDKLGAPAHVRQARVIVFASSQRAAYQFLELLDMKPRSARSLGPAHGNDVRELIHNGYDFPGNVYAIYNNALVLIKLLDGKRQLIRLIQLSVVDNESEVTDDMVNAACVSLRAYVGNIITEAMVRDALTTALQVQREAQQ